MPGPWRLPSAACGRSVRWPPGAKLRGRDGTVRYCLRETAWRASGQRGDLGERNLHLDFAVPVPVGFSVLGGRGGQRLEELAPGADGLVVTLVGLDDGLHQQR